LAKIENSFDLSKKFGPATIIWSGNGYHLYIPADSQGVILEQMPEFSKFKEPSKEFLRLKPVFFTSVYYIFLCF
jgi:hypothetical protein